MDHEQFLHAVGAEDVATGVREDGTAIRAAVPFSSSDLGDSILSFLNGQWFVTD